MHGVSINVRPDLEHFRHIVPCGIDDRPVGSSEKQTGFSVPCFPRELEEESN